MHATLISPADTAKLVRAALKRSFPRTKFSVRTDAYAGGATVRVSWTDGPAAKLVERVTGTFAGKRYDPVADVERGVDHWLMPDGSAVVAPPADAFGNRGPTPPCPGARLVYFGAGAVSCTRRYSDALTARAIAKMRRDGIEWEGDEGPIRDGWPTRADACRVVHNDAVRRLDFTSFTPLFTDVLHRVRHAFMVA